MSFYWNRIYQPLDKERAPSREISDSRAQTGAFMIFGFTFVTVTLKDLVLLGYGNIPHQPSTVEIFLKQIYRSMANKVVGFKK